MSTGAAADVAMAEAGGTAPKATIAQKGNQEQHRDKRSQSDEQEHDHAYTEYYVNTHLRRRGYTLPQQPDGLPSTRPVDTAALGQPEGWDEDEDEGLDDEQGAQWEEWSREQKNEWVEKQVRDIMPQVKEHYNLPSNDRVNSNQDTAVYEGYAGVAFTAFHSYLKVLSSLPAHVQSFSASTPTSVRHIFTPAAAQHTAGNTYSPAGRVRNLAIKVPPDGSGSGISSSPNTPSGSNKNNAERQAEHVAHVKRQHCISLLQDAFDYILYCLALLDEKKDKATDSESNLSEEDRKQLKACEQRVSFILGKAGTYALAAVIYHHRARFLMLHPTTTPNVSSAAFDPNECLRMRGECMSKLMEMRDKSEEDDVDVEVLNGRAGYLYALNFVYAHLTDEAERMENAAVHGVGGSGGGGEKGGGVTSPGDRSLVDNMDDTNAQPEPSEERDLMRVDQLRTHLNVLKSTIELVHNRLIKDGTQTGSDVLQYTWHDKHYYGGAHGLAGILHSLLQSPPSVVQPTLAIIRSSVDYLLSLRLPSGNMPSSASSHSDRLVEWCHGASGTALLCTQLYTVTREPAHLQSATELAEVVWRRGLLKKGVGLCHGISGNGYVFLSLYHVTGEEVWLRRAYHFCHFAMAEHRAVLFRQPDQPYSLLNGMAGLVCYAVDMEQSERTNCTFPGVQLLRWDIQK